MRTNKIQFFLILIPIFFTMSCNEPTEQKEFDNYKLLEHKFIKELNSTVYYLEHIKSGAHILKIENNDQNKTFGIAFKTEPNCNSGTSHILEHSVLNGSKNYPAKSPFDHMAKTSLNTFLNAMTSSDATFYPVASMNEKDYFNLMNVYLDAVFHPLIFDDPRIFKQEGWHRELTDKDANIVYKGVVYNEMKGAFSNPQRELSYQTNKYLFPDNGYGFSSGGYPMDIPKLTYQQFLNYYAKHYVPENSLIVIYGDADMNKELNILNEKYLSQFEKKNVSFNTTPQVSFEKMKEITAHYSAIEGSSTENQTFLTLNWVYGKGYNQLLAFQLSILADVLINQEAAPIRLKLEEAGIGKDIYAYNSPDQQNTFSIVVKNANPEDKEKFKKIIFATLLEQSKNEINPDAIEAYINNYEFYLREGNTSQKGLRALSRSFTNWQFTGDPFAGLEWEKVIANVRTSVKQKDLEKLIDEAFLKNNHALLLTLAPKPGLEKALNDTIAQELAQFKASLSDKQIDSLINETNELIAYQQQEDSPENLKKLPKLTLQDIKKEGSWYKITEKEINDNKILHYNEFTNDITYINLMFDLNTLPVELLPYASILTEILGYLNTQSYNYGDLEKEVMKNTGTIYSNLKFWTEFDNEKEITSKFVIVAKALNEKNDKMFDLISEILLSSKFDDTERLKTILTKHQSSLESSVKNNGIDYAITRIMSYFSKDGMIKETTSGLEYFWFVNNLTNNFDQNKTQIIQNIKKTAELLFSSSNLITGVTCSDNNYQNFSDNYKKFVKNLPNNKNTKNKWEFNLTKKNEGIATASKVQYVIEAYDYKKLGYQWSGKMLVLNNILSREYLKNKVRIIGGAYGGFSRINKNGKIFFASYRDPNLKETLANYDSAATFVNSFEADSETLLGFIIGAISKLDQPLTPSQKGNAAINNFFTKYSKEQKQKDREELLSTSVDDIKSMSEMIADFIAKKYICIYGNKQKIEDNKNIFDNIIDIEGNKIK